MEAKLLQQKRSMSQKVPEIQLAIDSLEYIGSKNGDEVKTSFEVSECAIVQATITKPENVLLWLGANVMVEYPHAEALELLQKNLIAAKTSNSDIISQLGFLKDQITTCEVNVARIHNWKVEQKNSKTVGPQKA
jgi:prefoldin subunit 5